MDAGLGRYMMKALFNTMGNRYKRAARLFDLPSADLMAHLWSEQQYMFSEKEIGSLLNLPETHLSIKESWRDIDRLKLSDFEKISLFDIEQYLAYNLLYKMDIASMPNSLEVSNPYLYYRVMFYSYIIQHNVKSNVGRQIYMRHKLYSLYD